LLDAPKLGPVADTAAIFETISEISPLPVNKSTFMMLRIPILLPMLFVIANQIPLRDLLLKLLKTIV
jgi:hypothetical protein